MKTDVVTVATYPDTRAKLRVISALSKKTVKDVIRQLVDDEYVKYRGFETYQPAKDAKQ